MNLKLDENLGHTAAEVFRQAGHRVETVHTQSLSGAPDAEVIAMCRRERRSLVMLDIGFSNPLILKPSGVAPSGDAPAGSRRSPWAGLCPGLVP